MKKIVLLLSLISVLPLTPGEVTFSRSSQNPQEDLDLSFQETVKFLQDILDSGREIGVPSSTRKFAENYALQVFGDDARLDVHQRTFAVVKSEPSLSTIYFLRSQQAPFIITTNNGSQFFNTQAIRKFDAVTPLEIAETLFRGYREDPNATYYRER